MPLGYISSVLSHATSAASSLSSDATTLINRANSAISGNLTFADPGAWTYTLRKQDLSYTARDFVEGMPPIPATEPPEPPEFRDMSIYNGQPLEEEQWPVLPQWSWPPFQRPDPPNAPPEPTLESAPFPDLTLPLAPEIVFPGPVGLLSVESVAASLTINLPNLDLLIPPDPALPAVDSSAEARMRDGLMGGVAGMPGLTGLLADADDFTVRARSLLDPLLNVIEGRFADRHAAVFSTKEQRIADLADTRLALLSARTETDLTDLIDRSGWTLPAPVQAALRQRVQQQVVALDGMRTDGRALRVMDQARRMMAFCTELYGSLREGLETLRSTEIDAILGAHDAAVRLARQKIETLAQIFEAEHFRKYDLRTAYAEARLKVFESELAVERLRYDTIRQQIANEGLRQDQDRALVEQYETEAAIRTARLGVIEAQIDAARAEIDFQAFDTERFQARIDWFAARVNADEARLRRMLAEIEGNEAELQRQTAALQQYEMEMRGYEKHINVKSEDGNKKSAINDAMMDAYQGTIRAATLPVEHSLLLARQQLAAHEINAKIFSQDADLSRKLQKIDMDFLEQRQRLRRDVLRTFQELAADATETELGRRQAVAQVNARGAAVLANMGQGAMSAATMVGGGILEEFA